MMVFRFSPIVITALLLGGCVTYPYDTAFSACDEEAGACYRFCEEEADEGAASACRSTCEERANQCFAVAYDRYGYASPSYAYGYSSYGHRPWYGRYGYWYPDRGYYLSFDFHNGYNRHPYGSHGRRGGRHDSGDGRRHPRRGRHNDTPEHDGYGNSQPPPAAPPPAATPPAAAASPPPQPQPRTLPRRRPPPSPDAGGDARPPDSPPPQRPRRRPREPRDR